MRERQGQGNRGVRERQGQGIGARERERQGQGNRGERERDRGKGIGDREKEMVVRRGQRSWWEGGYSLSRVVVGHKRGSQIRKTVAVPVPLSLSLWLWPWLLVWLLVLMWLTWGSSRVGLGVAIHRNVCRPAARIMARP